MGTSSRSCAEGPAASEASAIPSGDQKRETVWISTAMPELATHAPGSERAVSPAWGAALLETSLDAVVVIDGDGRVVEFNPAAEKMFGCSRAQVLGLEMAELIIPPEWRESHRRSLARCLETGNGRLLGQRIEMEAQRLNGTRFPVELAISHTVCEGQRLFVGCLRDITARREAEEALRKREQWLRFALQSANMFAWDWDLADGTITRSGNVLEIVGAAPRTVDELHEIVHPDDRPGLKAALADALTGEKSFDHEFRIVLPNGRSRWLRDRAQVSFDAAGRPTRMTGVCADVTEHRQIAEAVRAGEQRFQAMIETSWDGLALTAADGTLGYVSPGLSRMLGYSVAELVGRSALDLVHPDDLPQVAETLSRLLDQPGASLGYECRARHRSGEWVWIESTATNLLANASIRAIVSNCRDVTERRRSAEALRSQKEYIEHIVSAAPTLLCGILPDGTTSFINRAVTEVTGYSAEELIGRNWWEVFYPGEEYAQVEQLFRDFEKGPVVNYEMALTTAAGDKRVISWNSVNRFDENGQLVEVVGIGADVTDQKQTEAELQGSEERLRRQNTVLTELARGTIHDHGDLAAVLQVITEAAARTLEVERVSIWLYHEERSLIRCADLYEWSRNHHSKGAALAASSYPAYFEALQEERTIAAYDAHSDPRTRAFSERYLAPLGISSMLDAPIRMRDRMVGVVCHQHVGPPRRWTLDEQNFARSIADLISVALEAAERQRAEAALRESEERFRLLVEGAHDFAMLMLDPHGRIVSWNAGAERLTGCREPEVLGQAFAVFYPPEEIASGRPAETLRTAEAQGHCEFDAWYLRKDGSRYWASVVVTALRTESGELRGFSKVIRDNSDRMRLEQQLRQAQKMEAIGRLAGGVAHDFNNMLGAITGFAELLLHQVGPDEMVRNCLKEIVKASERATALTRQLLTFSRKSMLSPRALDLNEVVAGIYPMLRRLISEDIELVTVPDPAAAMVMLDACQIEQVLLNLAINARDAMPDGGRLTITCRSGSPEVADGRGSAGTPPGQWVVLSVSDTGCGMDEETRSRLFEPFFTTKDAGKGTGLGLATVYGIVSQSGGQIEVESQPGAGTTFRISFPRTEVVAATPSADSPSAAAPAGAETILLVEDEPIVRKLVREVLQMQGYTVLEASQGEEALRVCTEMEQAIHLLLADVVMPGISGRELMQRATVLRPAMRVLLMSGYSQESIGLDEGGAEFSFIQKPFKPAALAQKVREVLGTS